MDGSAAVSPQPAGVPVVAPPTAMIQVGQVLEGKYRVDGHLGRGGMAEVFRGHHLGLERDVAIKVLLPELMQDPQMEARFSREAKSASRLDHPNCLRVTDYGTSPEGLKFMVMELLEGIDLEDWLDRPMPPPRAIDLMLQILRGLEHAHSKGIIHRDLKPENVFVTRDHDRREILKIVDFGIAKMLGGGDTASNFTRAGLIFGTPKYMSPEQATGDEIDARTDIYSAGVMLYQMLAGRPPFDAKDAVSLLRMQVCVDPEPLPANVPGELAAVTQKMLAKHRDGRFATAAEAHQALEAVKVRLQQRGREPAAMRGPAAPAPRAPPLATGGLDSMVARPMARPGQFPEPAPAPQRAAPVTTRPAPDPAAINPRVMNVSGPHVHPGAVLRVDRPSSQQSRIRQTLPRGMWTSRTAKLIMVGAAIPAYLSRPRLMEPYEIEDIVAMLVSMGGVWLVAAGFGLVLWRLATMAR